MSKRGRDEDQDVLLFVIVNKDASLECYTAPFELFSEADIDLLTDSTPFERKDNIPGCLSVSSTDSSCYFDETVWESVQTADVPRMTTIRRVVLGLGFE